MKLFSAISLFLLPFTIFSQGPKVDYLDQYLDVTKKNQAVYVRTLESTGENSFKADISFISGEIKATGEYLEKEDELVQNGYFVFYYPNGVKESEGEFKNGFKIGVWKRFMKDGTERSPKYYNAELGNMINALK